MATLNTAPMNVPECHSQEGTVQLLNTPPEDNLAVLKGINNICEKYQLSPKNFKVFCINKYKKDKITLYIENNCQCGYFDLCDICEDYWKMEIDHILYKDHDNDCKLCKFLERYYIAQAEFFLVTLDI